MEQNSSTIRLVLGGCGTCNSEVVLKMKTVLLHTLWCVVSQSRTSLNVLANKVLLHQYYEVVEFTSSLPSIPFQVFSLF